jgi:hypothetical protein
MKLVHKTFIPENLDLTGGNIEITDAKMFLNLTSQNYIEGFKVEIGLKINAEINCFKVPFESHVSHTFTDQEFINFMEYLNENKVLLQVPTIED